MAKKLTLRADNGKIMSLKNFWGKHIFYRKGLLFWITLIQVILWTEKTEHTRKWKITIWKQIPCKEA